MTHQTATSSRSPDLWFRVLLSSGSIGPGKIMLMRCIDETGSVSAAARRMRMSHSRSAKLVSELNMLAKEPLISTKSGGEAGGGAKLTILGQQVLTLYGELEEAVSAAAQAPLARLEKAILDV